VRAHRVDAVVLDGAVILHDDVRGVTLLLLRRMTGEETFAFVSDVSGARIEGAETVARGT
jgi:hypothetical protein